MSDNELETSDIDLEQAQEENLFEQLFKIVKDLGWDVAIPSLNPDDNVPGIIIGTPQYIEDVIAGKYADADDQLKDIKEEDG